jgi:hypothetical protein
LVLDEKRGLLGSHGDHLGVTSVGVWDAVGLCTFSFPGDRFTLGFD